MAKKISLFLISIFFLITGILIILFLKHDVSQNRIITDIYNAIFSFIICIALIKLAVSNYSDKDDYNNEIPTTGLRFLSQILDMIILLPIILLFMYLKSKSILFGIIFTILSSFIVIFYHVYFNGKFGCTPGKMILKIKIIKYDNKKMNYKDAFLRSSIDICFSLLFVIGSIYAFYKISNNEYIKLGYRNQIKFLSDNNFFPTWVNNLSMFYIWIEIITLIFNKKRRAFHDLIANTIVIKYKKTADNSSYVV